MMKKQTQYRRLKKLGSGNYGDVILIESYKDKKKYALKRINLNNSTYDEIINEINVQQEIDHPNIIKCYGYYKEFNRLCIIMEYAECGDLEKYVEQCITKNQEIPEEQICLAIQCIHEKHILHRDIKLSNVFLSSDGLIKLGDFGIAKKLRNTDDLATTTLGTPFYISPEICLNQPYSYKSDIWMLGCLLYELITFEKPFKGISLHAIVKNIIEQEPNYQLKNQNISGQNLIKCLLQKQAESRPTITQIITDQIIQQYVQCLTSQNHIYFIIVQEASPSYANFLSIVSGTKRRLRNTIAK